MKTWLSAILCLCCCLSVWVAEPWAQNHERPDESFAEWLGREEVDIYGSVEVEYRTEEGFDDAEGDSSTTSSRDVSVDLGVVVQPISWFGAELAVSWDDANPAEIDAAAVTLGNPELFPVYIAGGKLTLPFGRYETAMLSDTLPQEIGETKQETALLGLVWNGLEVAVFAFDGSTEQGEQGDGLESYGGAVSYLLGKEDLGLLLGAGWVDNLEDSDGLSAFFAEEELALQDRVAGLAAYSQLTLGPVALFGEYVGSLERPAVIDDEEGAKLERQQAWAAELAVALEVSEVELEWAGTYGETRGVGDLLPQKRYGGALTVTPLEHLRLAVEYLKEVDYPLSSDGTGDRADIVTFQLAAQF